MFLDELIEQHRVHRFVANAINFSMIITRDQVRIYLRHFLGDQAKLRDRVLINLRLVMKGNRLQRENRFTRFVHRFDLVFETR